MPFGPWNPSAISANGAVEVEAQNSAIPAHGTGEDPSFGIGNDIIKTFVAGALIAGDLAQCSIEAERGDSAVLEQQQRAVLLQREAAGDARAF